MIIIWQIKCLRECKMNIKNCPFCGSTAKIIKTDGSINGPGNVYVRCTGCEADVMHNSETMWLNTDNKLKIDSAIEKWNKRV